MIETEMTDEDLADVMSQKKCTIIGGADFITNDMVAMPSEGFDYDDMVQYLGYRGLKSTGIASVLGGPTVHFFEMIPNQTGFVAYQYSGDGSYIVYKF